MHSLAKQLLCWHPATHWRLPGIFKQPFSAGWVLEGAGNGAKLLLQASSQKALSSTYSPVKVYHSRESNVP
jgi:hypothetical protein